MVFKFCAIDTLLGESGVLGARWRVAANKESSLFASPEQLAAASPEQVAVAPTA
jgi:hypothetical protein